MTIPSATRAIDWLLACSEPAIRYRTLTELLDRPAEDPEVLTARAAIPGGPIVRALLAGQAADGTFGGAPYRKWTGGHWRLVSLADLRYPPGAKALLPVIDAELRWATRIRVSRVAGRARRCASQEGNAIGACCRLGFAGDHRIGGLVQRLIDCQWPDGGWNCDRRPEAGHSSFHESVTPLWGLAEYRLATGDARVDDAIERAAQMLLRAELFRSERRRLSLWPHFMRLRYPPYWHYDVLFGLRVLADAGRLDDRRTADALDVIEHKRRPDGLWAVDGAWWRAVGGQRAPEAVDWGRSGPSTMVTFHAMRVLRLAGREVVTT